MNEHNKIESLLNKYWDCETSLQEEQELKSYFQRDDVAPQFEEFKAMFQYFSHEATLSKEIDIRAIERSIQPKTKRFTIGRRMMSVAASLILLASIVFLVKDVIPTNPSSSFASHEVQDSDEALEITMEALAFLSNKLDKSSTQIRKDLKSVAAADILK